MPRRDPRALLFAPSLSLSQEVPRLEGRGMRRETGAPVCPSALAAGGCQIPRTGTHPETRSAWQTFCTAHALNSPSCELSLQPCFIQTQGVTVACACTIQDNDG
jgi:hypothetical protein